MGYARRAIRDWMETPKDHEPPGIAPLEWRAIARPFRGEGRLAPTQGLGPTQGMGPAEGQGEPGAYVSDTIGLTLPANCLRPRVVAWV